MKTVYGDLIEKAKHREFDVIVHGCNCFCTMGAGIAKGIKAVFPAAYVADTATPIGDRKKLGTCSTATIPIEQREVVVINAYTQYHYRGTGRKVDYDAVRACMRWIKAHFSGKRLGLPRIGAGLAGGDWTIIRQIIEKELDGEDVSIVKFRPHEGENANHTQ